MVSISQHKGSEVGLFVKEWFGAKCEFLETGKQVDFSFGMESGSGIYLNLFFCNTFLIRNNVPNFVLIYTCCHNFFS